MISTWIWSKLPGTALSKALLLLVAAAAVVFVLFEYVFPWISEALALQEQSVEEA